MQRLYENYSSIEQMTDRLLQSDNKKTKHSSESDSFLSGKFKPIEEKEHIISSHGRLKFFQTCKWKTGNEEYQSFRLKQMESMKMRNNEGMGKGIQSLDHGVDDLAFIVNVKK